MKKTVTFLLVFLIITGLFANLPVYGYSAKALALCEMSTGSVLQSVNADERLAMASTTKIMTAVVVLENADLSQNVKIPLQATNVEGSSMYLKQDEVYTIEQLLYGLMLTSGNDAATALAYYVGKGNVAQFVNMMNSKAKSLGLENTNFTNPSGLPDDNHYTTARELASITRYALSNPVFAKIVKTRQIRIKDKTFVNHNKLLTMYEGAVGVKTGFTKKAGRCLVSAATKNGVTLICVTLNASDDWNDHISALDYGFEKTTKVTFHPKDSCVATTRTPGGKEVILKNVMTLEATLMPGQNPVKTVYAPNFVYAPKKTGDIVGKIEYTLDGIVIAKSDLYVAQDITEPVKKELFISKIIRFIRNLF